MSDLTKVRVQLLDAETGEPLEDVDVLTSAGAVTFSDGKTLQEKVDDGELNTEINMLYNQSTFTRIPCGVRNSLGYQGWCANSIVKYNGNYAVLTYLRDGHTGSLCDLMTVFFNGTDIVKAEQCIIDEIPASQLSKGALSCWQINDKYYTIIDKTLYETLDMVNWTSVAESQQMPADPWGVYNIDNILYATYDTNNYHGYISESIDSGITWTNKVVSQTHYNGLNEGNFIKVNDNIICFFGKDWSGGEASNSDTDEQGRASICIKTNGEWGQPFKSNIICNAGNLAGWFDGNIVHVVSKSRRYHLNGGDASALYYYVATPEDAVNGQFTFIKRIDTPKSSNEGKWAIDSTSVSIYVDENNIGLLVSPVSCGQSSGTMKHTYYAINQEVVNSEIYNSFIQSFENEMLINKIGNSDKSKLRCRMFIDSEDEISEVDLNKRLYAYNGNAPYLNNGYIHTHTFKIGNGSDKLGYVKVKNVASEGSKYIGYTDSKGNDIFYRFALNQMATSQGGTKFELPFEFIEEDNFIIVIQNGNTGVFFFKTNYGIYKVINYVSSLTSDLTLTFAPPIGTPFLTIQSNSDIGTEMIWAGSDIPIKSIETYTSGEAYDISQSVTPNVNIDLELSVNSNITGFLKCEGASKINVSVAQQYHFYASDKETLVANKYYSSGDIEVPEGAVYVLTGTNSTGDQVAIIPYDE